LSNSAFNALLKTLEEPPEHVIFILATTEVHKVPATITSRCQRFDLRRIPLAAMIGRLDYICQAEGISSEPEALALIAKNATGSLRDAENMLEQMVVYHGSNIELQQVRSELGLTGDARIKDLRKSILTNDIRGGLAIINGVADDGLDLRQFNRELTDSLRNVMLVKAGAEDVAGLVPEELNEMRSLAADASLEEISQAIRLFSQADFRFSPQSTLPLELALIDCAVQCVETAPEPKKKAETTPRPKKEQTATPVQSEPKVTDTEPPIPAVVREVSRTEGSSDIQHIQKHWNELIKACKGTKGNIDALLRGSCEPVSLEGNALILGFYAPFHKDNFDNPKFEYTQILKEKLNAVFSIDCDVQTVLIGKEKRPAPPPARENHLVKEALAHGAKIISEEYMR